ncbi:MAG: tape measure protein [Liquorilactobacillus nagelii]|uniref:tape measure protein n=1 Tax=Liquorilactobacillus nagelii TaxID=82688 RepID=UPI00243270AA|nr:tape measure protein [Liquorilactobacillus nagelii]MCI1632944.1 tape measure protein [Liquorilactobacillus nagelii]
MADGAINIDFNIPIEKAISDVQKIKSLFSGVGDGAGDKLDQNFEENTDKVESNAESTHKKVVDIFGKDAEQKIKGNNSDLNEKVSDSKAKLKQLPGEAKTKLIADAKMNGIENFESLIKKLPKSKQTELLAKVSDGKAVDYEELLRKIPSKRVTEVKLNDNASSGLKKLKDEADNTGSRFSRLKDIIVGSFAGQLVFNGINALQEGMKELISSSVEYNKEQQVSLASWTTLTNSASKGQAMVDMANTLSTKFGQSRDMVDELDQQFYHVLDDSGKTQTLTTSFLTLADTIGLSSDQVKTLGQDFTHTLSGGKLQLGDFNQIADYLPMFGENLLKYEQKVQKNSKLTMSQLQAEMSAGKISAKDAMTVINQLGDKYKASADNMMNTLPGMERAIKAKAPALVSAFINPFLTAENPLAKSVMKWVNDPSTMSNLKSFGKSFAVVANGATTVIMTAFGGINNILSSFAMSFKANVAGVITSSGVKGTVDSFVGSFKNFAKAIEPVESAVGGLVGVIAGGVVRTNVAMISGLAKGFEDVGSKANGAKKQLDFSGVFKVITNISQALNAWYDALSKIYKPLYEIIGEIAKGAFEVFADVVNGIAKGFSKLVSGATGAAGPVGSLAKGLQSVADHHTALKAVGIAIGSIVTAVLAIKGVLAIMSAFKTAITVVQGAIAALNVVLELNPIILITTAIIAAGLAFYEAYKHIKPFRDAVNAVGKAIVSGLKTAFDWVKKNWVGLALMLVNPIAGGLKLLYDNNSGFRKWADSIWSSVKSGLKSFEKGWNSFWGSVGKTLSSWGKTISKTWSSIWSGIEKVSSVIWNGLKKAAGLAFKSIVYTALAPLILMVATVVAIWKLIEKPTMAAWNLIKQYIVKPIQEAYKSVVNYLKQLWKDIENIWDSIKKYTSDVFNTIYKFVKKIWDEISDFIVDTAKSIWKTVVKWFDELKDDIEDIWNAIKKFTMSIWNPIKDFVVDVAEDIWKLVTKTFNKLASEVSNIWNGIKSVTVGVWNAISGWVVSKAESIWKGITGVFNSLKNDISGILDAISSKWHDMWNGVSSFFSGIWKDIKGVAKSGINGVIGFLNGGIDGVDTVVHFFGGSKKAISDIPKLAKGSGPVKSGTPAIVNDEQASDFREAILRKDGSVDIPNGRNVLTYLDEGDSVVPAAITKSIFGNIPQYAGGTGDWLGKLWSGTKSFISSATDKAKAIADAIAHPLKTIKGIFSKVTNSTKGVWNTLASSAGGYLANNAVNWFKKTLSGLEDAIDGDAGGTSANPSGSGVKRWTADVKKALAANGLSTSDAMVAKILRQIKTESGGNPNARQPGADPDGDGSGPALGLMQTKRSTFNANAFPGHKSIFNGYDNLLAALHYAKRAYGSSLSYLGNGHGYADGGTGDQEGYYKLFEGNNKEFVVPNPSVAGIDRTYAVLGQAAAYVGAKGGLQNNSASIDSSALQNAVNKLVSLQSQANSKLEKSINKKMQVVLDSGKLVGGMYSKIDQKGYDTLQYQQRNVWG